MKKFLIIATTVAILMSIFCVTAFAEVDEFREYTSSSISYEENIYCFIPVKNSNILIPCVQSKNITISSNQVKLNFFEYLVVNYTDLFEEQTDGSFRLYLDFPSSEGILYFELLENAENFFDILINFKSNKTGDHKYYLNSRTYALDPEKKSFLRAYKSGTVNQIVLTYNDTTDASAKDDSELIDALMFIMYTVDNVPSGYTVNIDGYSLPQPPIEVNDIPSVLLTTLKGFINGIGTTFVGAFQSLFMNKTVSNGVATYSGINSLGIYILIFFGVALGYGVVRWLTGLFRRESR